MWLKKRHLASEHAHPGPSLPTRMGDQRREDRNVPTKPVRRRAIPISGHQNPYTMGEHNHRTSRNHGMNTWRAESQWKLQVRFAGAGRGNPPAEKEAGHPGPTPTPNIPPDKRRVYCAVVPGCVQPTGRRLVNR